MNTWPVHTNGCPGWRAEGSSEVFDSVVARVAMDCAAGDAACTRGAPIVASVTVEIAAARHKDFKRIIGTSRGSQPRIVTPEHGATPDCTNLTGRSDHK
ncbi:hypothetical protein ABZ891_34175 [Streptomyces sp. NPDC047023]|uniref:hypothetical protein n=1 Tax=Streptomyces sp. NPDC047023 TaxID=3155139 RepID=UPI0033E0F9C4